MNLDTIVTELKAERDRLDRAIAALEGAAAPASPKLVHTKIGRRGRRVTAEARRRMSVAQKRRRAKEKKRAMQSES